jgi:GTP cyclohydrolase I
MTTKEEMKEMITKQLEYIGEDPHRPGLQETPARMLKSWDKILGGYKRDPKDILTTFDSDGYDQIVLLKDIEMYSTCEHHWQTFSGRAHVAYIPGDQVIGISKLARLVEIYARRLQIQERIGMQVTDALMKHLRPEAAACVIEAKHFCMCARGVEKQHSTMITSAVEGKFKTSNSAKSELMSLIYS